MPIIPTPRIARLVALTLAGVAFGGLPAPTPGADLGPFARFDLPDAWEDRFWASPEAKAFLELEPRALADLVPTQAGLKFCRCPRCDAPDDDALAWSLTKPGLLTCLRCSEVAFDAKDPPKFDGKPEEAPIDVVEVRPRVFHKYPYTKVDPERQRYPEERLYLAARRDYEIREWLAKAALYAAVRSHEQKGSDRDPELTLLASVLLLRFAQVYPLYATHVDGPGEPKQLQPADLGPPYQRGFRTGRWDWLGCLDVPLNLVIAYALVREEAAGALAEAGRILGDGDPAGTIERDLLRRSAAFVRRQVEQDEYREESLYAYRGLLAVGRALGDPELLDAVALHLAAFAERGFYHDGVWRGGDLKAQRRVLAQLDGWIARLATGAAGMSVPMLALAREAGPGGGADPPEVRAVSWPGPAPTVSAARRPALLGGAGIARLAVGEGAGALDLELRGLGDLGGPHFGRLALRLAVGGRAVLGDRDDLLPSVDGWDRATASHGTVLIDGLNQREDPERARRPMPGSDVLFFAADRDFQVATMADRFAYEQSAGRYRRTILAVAGPRTRYGVEIFEVHGGLQHDQLFHAAAGWPSRWQLGVPLRPGPASLLPPTIPYVDAARAEDGRWFVQAMGGLRGLSAARLDRFAQAALTAEGISGLRLHLMGDTPQAAVVGTGPEGASALVLRRTSSDGASLKTMFVTVFEPVGPPFPPLRSVGRVASPPGTVVLRIETVEGMEHLVVNLRPGTETAVRLADGRMLRTDGLAVRAGGAGLVLAGGSFAALGEQFVHLEPARGTIRGVVRGRGRAEGGLGLFEADHPLPRPEALAGRALVIRHGDGTARGWTVLRAENTPQGRAFLHVREEPGFHLDPETGAARYYQFPLTTAPGPHTFHVDQIAR